MLSLVAACGDNLAGPDARGGGGGDDSGGGSGSDASNPTTPTVLSVTPASAATLVPLNSSAMVTFSEAMDRSTLIGANYTLTFGTPGTAVTGTVIATSTTATFWPSTQLAPGVEYTAALTVAAKSAAGVALAAPYSWKFTTGTTVAPGLPVNLGTAGNFVLLAKSGITTVPTSAITGNLGISPIAATAFVGFGQTADSTNVFSTAPQVTGRMYAANYAPPTPSNLTTAVSDMETAFVDAAGRAPDVTGLGAGTIGSITLAPGVYKWGTGLLIPTSITLTGSATDVWIFQVAGNLTIATAVNMTLGGNAMAKNIFWQVAGQMTAGTSAHLQGIFLTSTASTLDTGAGLDGRLLAQTAIIVRGSTIVQPAN
ncbi:hypothetical protein BH11MYX3_BH11MYX3_00350 [soil metagenome]